MSLSNYFVIRAAYVSRSNELEENRIERNVRDCHFLDDFRKKIRLLKYVTSIQFSLRTQKG